MECNRVGMGGRGLRLRRGFHLRQAFGGPDGGEERLSVKGAIGCDRVRNGAIFGKGWSLAGGAMREVRGMAWRGVSIGQKGKIVFTN